jgi:nitrogen fixation protein NifU and related proteins
MYSDKVMQHFRNPQNVGQFENPDGVGEVGNPQCGDMMKIGIMVEQDAIKDIRFQTLGCAAAIATSSIITEMAKGMKLADAEKLTRDDVADALDGLPAAKMHCSNLAADALREAIKDYRTKHSEKGG